MNEYEEAFHKTVLEALDRAMERSAELRARTAEAKVKSDHIRAHAQSIREQALHLRSPRAK